MDSTERSTRPAPGRAAAAPATLLALVVAVRDAALRAAVRARTGLERRTAVLLAAPQRGASAIEWVLITAVVVVIVGVVALVIRNLVVDAANDIQIDIPNG